jgi:hypothetical protein
MIAVQPEIYESLLRGSYTVQLGLKPKLDPDALLLTDLDYVDLPAGINIRRGSSGTSHAVVRHLLLVCRC